MQVKSLVQLADLEAWPTQSNDFEALLIPFHVIDAARVLGRPHSSSSWP
jgi:hypothetical protein